MANSSSIQSRVTVAAPAPVERAAGSAKLVIGCGYLGRRVADRWRNQGHEVFVLTRAAEHAAEFQKTGLRTIVADVMRLETLAGLPTAETVLYAVGYDRNQTYGLEELYLRGLVNVLNALPAATGRVIYVSSTGVYGDRKGEWIDEHTPCFPDRPGGRACLAAEEALIAHPRGAAAIILRMAGIYGPGRVPSKDKLESGRAIPAPASGWLNLVHVDDAVTVVLAAGEARQGARHYLVSDGHPVSRRDYYRELAGQMHAPAPRFMALDATAPSTLRAASDKRVSNARLVAEMGVRFRYPSYREGLAAILAGR
jgi:nucleoside-diphosphate-sugar epimerase